MGAAVRPSPALAKSALTFAAHIRQPPTLEGALTDPVWRSGPKVDLFTRLEDGYRATTDTYAHLLWDDDNLYLGVRCSEPDMSQVVGRVEARDGAGIWRDDCLEIFLVPASDDARPYHWIVNAIGTLYDEAARNEPAEWDSHAVCRTSVAETFWEAEIQIPFADLGGAPVRGDTWRLNIGRHRAADGEKSSWSGVRKTFHAAEQFGSVVFGGSVPSFTWTMVGDEFGDLLGGATLRGEVYNPRAVPVEVSVKASVVDANGNVAIAQDHASLGSYEVQPLSLTYRGKVRAPRALRVEATVPGDAVTVAVSGRVELRPRFFLPRLEWLRARCEEAAQDADPAVADKVAKRLLALTSIEEEVNAAKEPSEERWLAIDKRITALAVPKQPGAPPTPSVAPKTGTLTAASPEEATPGQAYLVYPVHAFEPVVPSTPPRAGDLGKPVSLFACRGEREPGSFVVHASEDLAEVSIRVTDLTGEAGVIPQRYLSARVVKCWRQHRERGSEVVPELLLRDDRVALRGSSPSVPTDAPVTTDIEAGSSKQVWVTVKIPDNAEPGTYFGKAIISPADHPAGALGLEVRVLPFDLPTPQQWLVMDHRASLAAEGALPRTEELYARELRDILAHGFRYATAADQGDQVDAFLDVRWRVGMSGILPYCARLADADAVREIRAAAAKRQGWTLLFGLPELRMEARDAATREHVAAVRSARGVTIGEVALDQAEELSPLVDLPIYSVEDPGFVGYAKSLSIGAKPHRTRELYAWDCTREDPRVNRLFCGFYLHKTGMKGALAQTYQRVPALTIARGEDPDPYDEVAGGVHYPLLAYPSEEGPIPTVQWEAAREGIDDLRYVLLLEQTLAATAGDEEREPTRELASAFLSQLRAIVQLDHQRTLQEFWPKRCQELRWEAARLTLALTAEPGNEESAPDAE